MIGNRYPCCRETAREGKGGCRLEFIIEGGEKGGFMIPFFRELLGPDEVGMKRELSGDVGGCCERGTKCALRAQVA